MNRIQFKSAGLMPPQAKRKHTVTIRFSIDKNGRRRAHYWGLARRWLPISIDAAELKLATGEAVPQIKIKAA